MTRRLVKIEDWKADAEADYEGEGEVFFAEMQCWTYPANFDALQSSKQVTVDLGSLADHGSLNLVVGRWMQGNQVEWIFDFFHRFFTMYFVVFFQS